MLPIDIGCGCSCCPHLGIHDHDVLHEAVTLLQFARLESLLQQAGRSPGRQNWTQVGDEQVRAATGVLYITLFKATAWAHHTTKSNCMSSQRQLL